MPTVQRSRTIAASPEDLWEVLGDPHHLPRWWPRVSRVEAVPTGRQDAFTEVLTGPSGKIVRADFKLLEQVDRQRIVWSQQVENTPFARVLRSAETEITLAGASGGTLPAAKARRGRPGRRTWRASLGYRGDDRAAPGVAGLLAQAGQRIWIGGLSRFGSPLVRRAARSTIDEALDGLERIMGGAAA